MKRVLVALAAVGLLAGLATVPVSAAPGGVPRNQITTKVYQLRIGYWHTYTIVFGCEASLSATGYQWGPTGYTPATGGDPTVHYPDETVTATLSSDGLSINISAIYGSSPWSPYSWTGGFPVAGGTGNALDSNGGYYTFPVVVMSTTSTTYANHGDYVSSMGGGDDAAHSCIGMPIVAQQ